MEKSGNKTIICSVFFLDIVEYSKRSVSGQISLKERFNAFLSEAIRTVPSADRIILDTGDGAAISFLGDVEDALRAALSMQASLLSEEGTRDPALLVRMGINLGPVRLVRDINGQPNIVGDGINVAQRVMGFAASGQILVSRSYYDAASRLSPEYAGLFHYQGSRTDKHVREHEVYAIGQPGENKMPDAMGMLSASQTSVNRLMNGFSARPLIQKLFFLSLFLVPAALLMFKSAKPNVTPPAADASLVQTHPVSAVENAQPALVVSSVPAAVSEVNPASKTPPAKKVPEPKHTLPPAPVESKPKVAPVVVEKAKVSTDTVAAPVRPPAAKSAETPRVADAPKIPGTVSLTIKPWGEVYLDGQMIDVSPPLSSLKVPVGEHVLEIRNTTFPPFRDNLKVKSGEKISIRHSFSN